MFLGRTACSPATLLPWRDGSLRIGAVAPLSQQILLHLKRSRRLIVEPAEVYYLEASGDETIVRRRGRQTLRDV